MSKRIHTCRFGLRRAFALAALVLLIQISATSPAFGNRPQITIERTHNTIQGTNEYVDVRFEPNGGAIEFGSFDFTIGYDEQALDFISAEPGMIPVNCGWEYFTYVIYHPTNCQLDCPSGAIRFIGIADYPSVPSQPSCFAGDSAGTLVVIKFLLSNSLQYQCTNLPIRFYWDACDDNVLGSINGDSLFVADSIFWGLATDLVPFDEPSVLGSTQGLPDSCLTAPIGGDPAARAVDFVQGYIGVHCPSVGDVGDINLNGIGYEVADFLILQRYFLDGLQVFTVDVGVQIAESDVNRDGVPLTFRDLAYLQGVIYGYLIPNPNPEDPIDTLPATFSQDTLGKRVYVDFAGDLTGAILRFDGTIHPTFTVPAWCADSCYRNVNGETWMIVSGADRGAYPDGVWLSYTGSGSLFEVFTSDWSNNIIVPTINFPPPSTVCGDADYSFEVSIADAVYLISYIFGGGPAPVVLSSGDADCSGQISIADVVYLIQYIFAGGAAPCAGCP